MHAERGGGWRRVRGGGEGECRGGMHAERAEHAGHAEHAEHACGARGRVEEGEEREQHQEQNRVQFENEASNGEVVLPSVLQPYGVVLEFASGYPPFRI